MTVITTENLTKDFGNGKGIFQVSLAVKKGECYGFLGPNGAGKSTTMRHLMGFYKPQSGTAAIAGLECWQEQKQIQKRIGYLPGEIAFPEDMTGKNYIRMIAKMRAMKDLTYEKELEEFFEVDPNFELKRMSKGTKQKIGIILAFMHKPEILLLDEPSSGLDPLMQNKFIELMEQSKRSGTTILLSSHMFEEVERTCDRIGIIKNGKMIQEIEAVRLKHSRLKTFCMECENEADLDKLLIRFPNAVVDRQMYSVKISLPDYQINDLIRILAGCRLRFLKEEKHTLEEYFMQFYGGEAND
ncbi:MAG: transporter ATP-binding protein [Herbinix sp.]|jgi:ABC-2 type transport system ATP-binding protein|nr:transporter ATP-binding protein [Herbinix sp.]